MKFIKNALSVLLLSLNCTTKQECEDSKRIEGVKKEVICASLNIIASSMQSPYPYGKTKTAEQISTDAFLNDLRLLLIGNCVHPSKPTNRSCKNTLD